MQALYAYSMKPFEDPLNAQVALVKTVRNCYTLFLWFFSIFPELTYYRRNKLEDLKGKHNPTPEDLNPNLKFVENQVIQQIEDNTVLKRLFANNRIDWSNDTDVIVRLFHIIEEMEEYKTYMANPQRSYDEDRKLVLAITEKVIAPDEYMHWFFSEKDTNWLDDYEEALYMMYRNVERFKQKAGTENKIFPLYKDTQDEEGFIRKLFSETVKHDAEYERIIEEKLHNWELERVTGMDILLIKMAICEFVEFSGIPIKVTMNEYIELAKLYSTGKSHGFVNGVLDKLLVDLKEQGKINKTGTGLYQK